MSRRVRKFVDRAFSQTVDLDLLKRFLAPYQAQVGFDWDRHDGSEGGLREAAFTLFSNADGRFPANLQFALFNISTLSTEAGASLLQQHAEDCGVALVPRRDVDGPRDGRHLNPRYLALVAWLDHRAIFDRALDAAAFYAHSGRLELSGRSEGVAAHHDVEEVCVTFKARIAEYFARRYQGRYCDVRWYNEDDRTRALILHGAKASTKNVDHDGAERSLKYREIVQDTIEYDAMRGTVSIGAKSMPDARALANLFAEHMLGDPAFFEGSAAGDFYTLEPIGRRGKGFVFRHDWDGEVVRVQIREVQVDEGERVSDGRKRYSVWMMTVRDKENALVRLADLAPDIDFADLRINTVKLEFVLKVDGVESSVLVKIKPLGLASFRDHSHESIILEHLERNGIRRVRSSVQVPAAAEYPAPDPDALRCRPGRFQP